MYIVHAAVVRGWCRQPMLVRVRQFVYYILIRIQEPRDTRKHSNRCTSCLVRRVYVNLSIVQQWIWWSFFFFRTPNILLRFSLLKIKCSYNSVRADFTRFSLSSLSALWTKMSLYENHDESDPYLYNIIIVDYIHNIEHYDFKVLISATYRGKKCLAYVTIITLCVLCRRILCPSCSAEFKYREIYGYFYSVNIFI